MVRIINAITWCWILWCARTLKSSDFQGCERSRLKATGPLSVILMLRSVDTECCRSQIQIHTHIKRIFICQSNIAHTQRNTKINRYPRNFNWNWPNMNHAWIKSEPEHSGLLSPHPSLSCASVLSFFHLTCSNPINLIHHRWLLRRHRHRSLLCRILVFRRCGDSPRCLVLLVGLWLVRDLSRIPGSLGTDAWASLVPYCRLIASRVLNCCSLDV